MTLRTWIGLSLALLPLCASAAPLGDVPARHWAAGAVHRVTARKIMTPDPRGAFHGERVVTRYELAVVLDRFVRAIEAGRKPLNPPAPRPVPVLPRRASVETKAALTSLIRDGFLPAETPLAKGPSDRPVTAKELSDAMAQVTIRLSDRSLPPTKV